jgi:hypothetical protein
LVRPCVPAYPGQDLLLFGVDNAFTTMFGGATAGATPSYGGTGAVGYVYEDPYIQSDWAASIEDASTPVRNRRLSCSCSHP